MMLSSFVLAVALASGDATAASPQDWAAINRSGSGAAAGDLFLEFRVVSETRFRRKQ